MLFHVTSRQYLSEIFARGIKNEKTQIVFLTNARKYLLYFFSEKEEPVLLCVNVKAMAQDGYVFFRNTQCPWMWITEHIPFEYIIETDFECNCADMI